MDLPPVGRCAVKRRGLQRKSRALADRLLDVIEEIEPPLTCRQVFYQAVVREYLPNAPAAYRQVTRLLLELRRGGELDYRAIVDHTRRRQRPSAWADLSSFAATIRGAYRKDLWTGQKEHVEVWVEKDAMAAFVSDVTDEYGIEHCVIRGYCSESMLWAAAEDIIRIGKPTTIFYCGDHDPSGRDIERAAHEWLWKYIEARHPKLGVAFDWERIAILPEDIERYDLPPQVAKTSDTRRAGFVKAHGDRTVELDALAPDVLRQRIRDAIVQHVDVDEWDRLLRVDELEQESVREVADAMASRVVLEQKPGDRGTP
jgi:hypothetical protein